MNQITMIQIVSKKHWITPELQGTDMCSTDKGAGTCLPCKKGMLYEGKKDLKESLRRKSSGKTCSLFRQEYSE